MSAALTNLGPYVLLGELGAGAMGVVYQARHVPTNRTVALKVLRAGGLASPELTRRLRVEAEAVASLEHPNIVRIYDVGEHAGQFFLSMKLVPGGTLAEALEAGPLAAERAATMLATIARAVEHAHQRGVLHRDLKPGNILIEDTGEAYLTDFGLAKIFSNSQDLTLSHALLGTPAYMAPEVAEQGARTATMAADIYSLGAVLYQMLTGRPPFTGDSPLQVLDRVRGQPPPAPRTLLPTLPRDLEVICLKCLSREPSARYSTAMELAEDLERFAHGEPITARQPGVADVFAWWIRRHQVAAGFTAALLATLAIGLLATVWQWRRAERFLDKTRAANVVLTEQIVRRDLREIEALLKAGEKQQSLQQLARLVKEHPENPLPATRLFSALTHRSWLWPVMPPLVHDAAISQGAFTPDGCLVLTASEDGFLQAWKVLSGERVFRLPHDTARGRFALSPDGWQFATLGSNGTAQIWRLPGGRLIHPALKLRANVIALAFSPDGQRLATADASGLACLWRVADGQLLGSFNHGETFQFLLFHPKGTSLITLGRTRKVWRLAGDLDPHRGGEPSSSPTSGFALGGTAVHAELSPNGDRLLTVVSNLVQIWDPQTAPCLREFSFNTRVNFASFSSDGSWIGSGNNGNRANIQNAWSGERRVTSMMHSGPVNTTRFHPGGQWVLTASQDGKARIWAASRLILYAETMDQRGELRDAQFSPNGKYLLTFSSDGTARLWAVPAPLADEAMLPLPEGEAIYKLSPNGEWLAAASADKVVRILPTSFHPRVAASAPHSAPVTALAFSPDSRLLASGDSSGAVSIRPVGSAKASSELPAKEDEFAVRQYHLGQRVFELKWSPSARRLAVVLSNQVCLLNLASALTNERVAMPLAMVRELDFSPDSSRVVLAGRNNPRASVFDCRTGQRLFDGPVHPGPVVTLRFSPNGRYIACGSAGNAVSLCDAATGRLALPFLHPGADSTCLAFSPDSLTLLTGLANGAVRSWDVTQGRLKQDLLRHQRAVLSGDFSPDGAWVATSSEDRFVRLTRVASALPGMDVSEPVTRPFVRFSQDGRRLLVEPDQVPPRMLKVPGAFRPSSAVLLALTELVLGQRINIQSGWEALSPEGYRTRLQIMRETFHQRIPPTQARFFRAPLSKRPANLPVQASSDPGLE